MGSYISAPLHCTAIHHCHNCIGTGRRNSHNCNKENMKKEYEEKLRYMCVCVCAYAIFWTRPIQHIHLGETNTYQQSLAYEHGCVEGRLHEPDGARFGSSRTGHTAVGSTQGAHRKATSLHTHSPSTQLQLKRSMQLSQLKNN
jgi:hypothetical protein